MKSLQNKLLELELTNLKLVKQINSEIQENKIKDQLITNLNDIFQRKKTELTSLG